MSRHDITRKSKSALDGSAPLCPWCRAECGLEISISLNFSWQGLHLSGLQILGEYVLLRGESAWRRCPHKPDHAVLSNSFCWH